MKKVIVGLSGGVDSCMAAFLLKKQGLDVTGINMKVWHDGLPLPDDINIISCLRPVDAQPELKKIADALGINFKILDCSAEFSAAVLDYFRNEYLNGRTPNPCVMCNSIIKFGILPAAAKRSGFDYDFFATGHYIRRCYDEKTKRYQLKKAFDLKKDQSYFLYRLTQEQLSSTIFPLGEMTKEEVRKIARENNLPVADKHDSQDFFCGDYSKLIGAPNKQGDIVDKKGKVIGQHNGIWNYTIGKRKGLTGGGTDKPLYVIKISPETNQITVGYKEDLFTNWLNAKNVNWVSIAEPKEPIKAAVKIRQQHKEAPATIYPLEGGMVKVVFEEEQMSITAGQSAVFYDGDTLLGGGIIE